jgi:hypothetical protein
MGHSEDRSSFPPLERDSWCCAETFDKAQRRLASEVAHPKEEPAYPCTDGVEVSREFSNRDTQVRLGRMYESITFLSQFGELRPFGASLKVSWVPPRDAAHPCLKPFFEAARSPKPFWYSAGVRVLKQQHVPIEKCIYQRNGGLQVRAKIPGTFREVSRSAGFACGAPVEQHVVGEFVFHRGESARTAQFTGVARELHAHFDSLRVRGEFNAATEILVLQVDPSVQAARDACVPGFFDEARKCHLKDAAVGLFHAHHTIAPVQVAAEVQPLKGHSY